MDGCNNCTKASFRDQGKVQKEKHLVCHEKLLVSFQDDMRQYIPLSSFGFYAGGVLDVRLSDFRTEPDLDQKMVTTVSSLLFCVECIIKRNLF